jgi:methylated-DNA-[protein]-cysteine S-methyltransferase
VDVVNALPEALMDIDAARLRSARANLVKRANADGLVDVAYRVVDSPFDPLLIAVTDAGLVRVAFALEDHNAVLQRLADVIGVRVMRAPSRLDVVARELDEYFAGRRQRFDLPLDLQLAAGFRGEVLVHLQDVPYGSTTTYAELAQESGSPRAVRAVGSACARNPVPIVVPCHRVVRCDGSIGQYLGGRDAKVALLRLEGAF